MGSKGSSGQTTSTTTSGPPQQVLDAYTALLARGNQVASTPYQAYTGQQVADLTPLQQSGIQTVNNAAGTAQPYIDQASALANQSAQPVTQNLPQYNAQNLQQYQDPYTQQVVNATQANFNENNAIQQNQLLGKAISSGASPFGGDRAGVAAADLSRQQNLANNQTIAGLESQGFQNAQTQFNAQQNLQLQGQNADAARQAQAAYLQGGLGTQAQTAALQGGQAQIQAGTIQQQQAQNQLNVPYQQFQQQQAFPYQQTQFLGNLTEGLGSNSGGTSTTTAPGPSVGSQAAGLGALGLGLGSLFKDGGVAHRASGGTVDLSFIDAPSWIPNDKLPIGHTIPNPPSEPKEDSGMSGIGSMLGAVGKGKPGSNGLGNLFSQNGLPTGSSMPGTADAAGFDQSSMPWLGDLGAATDLGSAMPWLADAGEAAAGNGAADAGLALFALAKDGGRIGYKSGGLAKFADGGYDDAYDSPDDSGKSFDMASENIPYLGATRDAAMAQADSEIDSKPTIDHSGDTTKILYPHEEDATKRVMDLGLPSPKNAVPTADTTHTEVKNGRRDWAVPLIAAGLATMSGRSPNALTNIGQGGLQGLAAYGQQQKSQREQQKQDIAEKRLAQQTLYQQQKDKELQDYRNKLLDLNQQKADQGKYQWLPGTGADDDGQQVAGIYRNDIKSGESTFIPGGTLSGKGASAVATPPGMSPVVAKEQAKTDAKRAQAYQTNKPVIDNIMSHLDVIEPNLKNFTTGSAGNARDTFNKAISFGADVPGVKNLIPNSLAQSADTKSTASGNIDKETSALALEMSKFQPSPGNRSSVLALKTMLANKPGLNLKPEVNSNRIAGIRADVMNYDLSEQLAQQYREASPYKMADSKVDQLDAALKTMYPIKSVDPQTAKVTFYPENVAKMRQAIPDAVRNPEKYLKGQTPAPEQKTEAPLAAPPVAQRTTGQVYATPKGNLKWTGTGWVN